MRIIYINLPRVLGGGADPPSDLANRALLCKSPVRGDASGGRGGRGAVSLIKPVGVAASTGGPRRRARGGIDLATVGSFEGGESAFGCKTGGQYTLGSVFKVREEGRMERGGGYGGGQEADMFFLIESLDGTFIGAKSSFDILIESLDGTFIGAKSSFETFPNKSSAAWHTDCVSSSLSSISTICTSLEILGNISLIAEVLIDTLLSLQSELMSISVIELHSDENSHEGERSVVT